MKLNIINIGYRLMCILNYITKRILFLLTGIIILGFLNSCGIYKPSDARIVSPNSKERVKKNLEEGKGLSLKKMMDGGGGTAAPANEKEDQRRC